jgi:NAD(P)-dependent dehydrogenase (short-subunit alcohol dehydrogenase family)
MIRPIEERPDVKNVILLGATQGIGRELAAAYARRGDHVTITGRDADRAAKVADEIEGDVDGIALDLSRPHEIAESLATVGHVDRLVILGMVRDANTLSGFDIARASVLAATKVVGYTTAVSALRSRLNDDAAVLLFGGITKDAPYPGSTTLSTVNAALIGMVRTLSIEIAPVRVNSIHPGGIEDSPFGRQVPQQALDRAREQSLVGRLGSMGDIVDGCLFLLENPMANGIDLSLDGGRV